jgi:hypothetical protein
MTRRSDEAVERALRRMLDADDAKNASQGHREWEAWQRAAADYWVLLHPGLASLRRGDPGRTPPVDEMRERADAIVSSRDGIPMGWRQMPPTPEKVEYLARTGWWHELMAGLYEPVNHAIDRLRHGDVSGIETLVRFLEADVYCHRSGYAKADAIRFLTRAPLSDDVIDRLRSVVLAVVDSYDRREFRSYIRLARRVDSDDLRQALRERRDRGISGDPRTVQHARFMLEELGEGDTRRREPSFHLPWRYRVRYPPETNRDT